MVESALWECFVKRCLDGAVISTISSGNLGHALGVPSVRAFSLTYFVHLHAHG